MLVCKNVGARVLIFRVLAIALRNMHLRDQWCFAVTPAEPSLAVEAGLEPLAPVSISVNAGGTIG
jgi:hypothetical protein